MLMMTEEAKRRLQLGGQFADPWLRRDLITLAGPKPEAQRKRWKLTNLRRDALVVRAAKILNSFVVSPFQYEGACRAGIRQELCLDAWPWREADAVAADVIERAFQKMGVSRPNWQEGQPDFATHTPIDFHWCQHCTKPIPEERYSASTVWGNSVRYCGDECSQSAANARNRRFVEHVDWATHFARLAAQAAVRWKELERAWQAVEEQGELDPLQVPAEREGLAYIIIGLWEADRDADLVTPAIARFFAATDPLAALKRAPKSVKAP